MGFPQSLLFTGRCYEAEICTILFLLRYPFIWYPFWSKSNFSDFGQKPWTIIRRFYQNQGDFLRSFYSSLESATKLKFGPFCSSYDALSDDTTFTSFWSKTFLGFSPSSGFPLTHSAAHLLYTQTSHGAATGRRRFRRSQSGTFWTTSRKPTLYHVSISKTTN